MWLGCISIGGTLSKKDRIPVTFANETRYSLKRDKIKQIKWDDQYYYIDYTVSQKSAPFYEKFEMKPPHTPSQ